MERKFPFGIFRPEKTELPFQMFSCSRKFPSGTTLLHVPFTVQPDFAETSGPIIPLQSSSRLLLSFSHPSLSYPTQATLPFYFSSSPHALCRKYFYSGIKVFSRERTRGLFLESPGNFSGQESCSVFAFKIKASIILKIIQ